MNSSQLRIGTFSRASLLSIKSLRAYHEQGILVPAAIDPETGYRVYEADQLLDAAVLKRLRDLDVPLRLVREVLQNRDPVVTERVLAEHASTMRQRLDDTVRIINELQRGVDHPAIHTPVYVRAEPHRHALFHDGHVDEMNFGSFLGEAYALLHTQAARLGISVTDVSGALYPHEIDDENGEDVSAFLLLEKEVAVAPHLGVYLGEIPATHVAIATHLGDYDSIGDTYRQLGTWVATNAVPLPLRVREFYLVSYPASPPEFRTEIHWPVAGQPPKEGR